MPASKTASQIARFIRICEDQGIKVTRTKKGLLIRFPDGTSTVEHFTNSDVRAEPNQIARFRRAGMVHPNDTRQKHDLPSYITKGTISPTTKARIVNYVVSQGCPEAVLSGSVVRDLKMDPGWVNKALYHSGFRPGVARNKREGRPWFTPDEVLALKDAPEPVVEDTRPEIKIEYEPFEEPIQSSEAEVEEVEEPAEPEPEVIEPEPLIVQEAIASTNLDGETIDVGPSGVIEETKPEVEAITLIDERDSWVADPEELLGEHLHRLVAARLAVLKAVGIEYEIRVWHK